MHATLNLCFGDRLDVKLAYIELHSRNALRRLQDFLRARARAPLVQVAYEHFYQRLMPPI